jgi:Uma2 family endonuclease
MADGFQTIPDPQPAPVARRLFSVVELDAMFDAQIISRDERIELIDGEIIRVNAQMMPHGVIKFNLAVKLAGILASTFRVSTETTVQLAEATLVDPDIFVTIRKPLERRYFRGEELLLAIEVADSSLGYDLGKKASLYAAANIAELWVIDVNNAQTWVHRLPSNAGYTLIENVGFDKAVKLLLDDKAEIIVGELLV